LTSLGAEDGIAPAPAAIDDAIARLRALATSRELARLKEQIERGDADQDVVREFHRLHRLQSELKAKRIAHAPVGNNVNANK
jgi:hypothetical protein